MYRYRSAFKDSGAGAGTLPRQTHEPHEPTKNQPQNVKRTKDYYQRVPRTSTPRPHPPTHTPMLALVAYISAGLGQNF